METNANTQSTTSTAAETLAALDDKLSNKTSINARIGTLKNRIADLIDQRDRQQGAADAMKHELDARTSIGTQDKQSIEARYSRVLNNINQLTQDIDSINADINQLETVDLPACSVTIDLDSVLELQRQIDAGQSVAKGLQASIDAQDKSISDAQATIPDVPNRQHERENMLADIAMGNATDAALKALDDRISQEATAYQEASTQVATIVSAAQATRSGLVRKLQDAQTAVEQLKAKIPVVLRLFLMQEAEKEAATYVEAAQHLQASYLSLRTLDMMIKNKGGESINGYSAGEMFIPIFRLPQFAGLQTNSPGSLMDTLYSAKADALKNTFQAAAAQKYESLKQLGVQL